MVKYFSSVMLMSFVLMGCQQPRSSLVPALPLPSFNGPSIAQATPPRPMPQPPPKATVQPAPQTAGIPREWLPAVPANTWRWIVIHHSATPRGGAAVFGKMHRDKGWDELGYHFVIGNGTDTGNGQIEVGSRWPKQKWGAHAKTPNNEYNNYGVGICLVGNFDMDRPTPEQMRSLAKLVAHMMKTYRIPADRVIGHDEAKATNCPGRNTSIAEIRRAANQVLANSGATLIGGTHTASRELMSNRMTP